MDATTERLLAALEPVEDGDGRFRDGRAFD
jgi:hypothetical protein